MFIAALFTLAKLCKQPKCPSTDEWKKKMWMEWNIKMEYYSAIKKNKILPFVTAWMDLESIMFNEMSERERQIIYVITYMWNIKK